MALRPWDDLMLEYRAMNGVLDFEWFDDVKESPGAVLACVRAALERQGPVNVDALSRLPKRRLTPPQFLGSWFDQATQELMWYGSCITGDGRELVNPLFVDLRRDNFETAAGYVSDGPGEFAYAFARPPYGLQAEYSSIAGLLEEFREALMAGGPAQEIDDFGGEGLPSVSAYFNAGAEWWGTFLWTIYDWQHKRVCVILGSATD